MCPKESALYLTTFSFKNNILRYDSASNMSLNLVNFYDEMYTNIG